MKEKKEKQTTVEFFLNDRKRSIASALNMIGSSLEDMKADLKKMVSELKDEGSEIYAMGIISKTSRSYSVAIEAEHSIDITLVVSDPIATYHNG